MSRAGPEGDPGDRPYALELDPGEVDRYRLMAAQARAAEADLWELAGMGPGGVAPFWASAGVIRPLARTAKAPTSARVRRRRVTVVPRVETSTDSPGRGRPMMRPALWNRQSESIGV